MPAVALQEIARATTMAWLLYTAPAWWGFAHTADRQRIECLVQRMARMGYLPSGQSDAKTLVTNAENRLLTAANQRHYHVLRSLFPPVITRHPDLNPRPHDFSLPYKDDHNYIKLSRVLYRSLKH